MKIQSQTHIGHRKSSSEADLSISDSAFQALLAKHDGSTYMFGILVSPPEEEGGVASHATLSVTIDGRHFIIADGPLENIEKCLRKYGISERNNQTIDKSAPSQLYHIALTLQDTPRNLGVHPIEFAFELLQSKVGDFVTVTPVTEETNKVSFWLHYQIYLVCSTLRFEVVVFILEKTKFQT